MISMDQFVNGVMKYYEMEIAQKADGLGKFAAYFVMPNIPAIIKEKAAELHETPFLAGLMDHDGLIDLEAVKDRAEQAMQHCGSVELMGFRLGQDDVDELYKYIRRA